MMDDSKDPTTSLSEAPIVIETPARSFLERFLTSLSIVLFLNFFLAQYDKFVLSYFGHLSRLRKMGFWTFAVVLGALVIGLFVTSLVVNEESQILELRIAGWILSVVLPCEKQNTCRSSSLGSRLSYYIFLILLRLPAYNYARFNPASMSNNFCSSVSHCHVLLSAFVLPSCVRPRDHTHI